MHLVLGGSLGALLVVMLLVGSCRPEVDPHKGASSGAAEALAGLSSADVRVRIASAQALRGGGEGAVPAVDALATALGDRNERVRQAAIEALRDLGPRAAPALPAVRRAFLDEDVYVRWHAAEALGRIGGAARDDLPALDARAADADEAEVVRAASKRAAERIRGS